MIVAQAGLMHTPWVGALVVLVALLLTRISGYLDKKENTKKLILQPAPESL